ncbi:hypothetical protein [Thalassotalea sp. PLHSN55]|uniref:hypothetical protein n=1 Tax=Thalassotalea sp. PLHSN55 TaxID=3435888 RepID=UPI003F82B354
MDIYKNSINKEALLSLPEHERDFFISIAHIQNEIRFALYGVIRTNDFSSSNEMIVEGQIAYNFYHLKILAGKLHEAWQYLNKKYFNNREFSQNFIEFSGELGQETLKKVTTYFGQQKSAVSLIRDKLAFHYSPEDLVMHLENINDDLNIYISKTNDINTLYYFAEAIVNRTVLSSVKNKCGANPIKAINEDVIGLAGSFNQLNLLFIKFFTSKYKDNIFNTESENMNCDELTLFETEKIPFFTNTDALDKQKTRSFD